jgi:SH3-like domain-containing protein
MFSRNSSKPRVPQEKLHIKRFVLLSLLALLPNLAAAVEFRSIEPARAVLYDSPSTNAGKLFVIGQGYPVEVIVNLGSWVKVRDNLGGLSWIEASQLSSRRTVLVTQDKAEIHQAAETNAAVTARLEQNVVLEMLEPPRNGWIKVRHRDGLVGYILASSVWGY